MESPTSPSMAPKRMRTALSRLRNRSNMCRKLLSSQRGNPIITWTLPPPLGPSLPGQVIQLEIDYELQVLPAKTSDLSSVNEQRGRSINAQRAALGDAAVHFPLGGFGLNAAA